MRREAEHFGDRELDLVYIAKRLNEAQRLESLLTESGIDYLVEADYYVGGVLFRSERAGAFFYVTPEMRAAALEVLGANGMKPHQEAS